MDMFKPKDIHLKLFLRCVLNVVRREFSCEMYALETIFNI